MLRRDRSGLAASWIALAMLAAGAMRAGADEPQQGEFFEKQVRPLLVGRCQGCHGPEKQKGGLRLDSRSAALAGGGTGPAVVPGEPSKSLLVEAINYGDAYQMPPKSKLPAAEIDVLTRWVAEGARWPEAAAHSADAEPKPFDLAERARHWSFQPVRDHAPPAVADASWPVGPIDQFLLARLEADKLHPAADADRSTWLRRVTFDLIGLPPTAAEVEAFLSDLDPKAYESVVDRLLASPRYGERWARHWLDLVRYADTSGHEFDYDIPNAYRYRDYVIRAFNADLPFDRFAVEHLAGDLVEPQRLNPADGSTESIQGTGVFLLGEGTHSPVDLRDEQARRVDDQVDVVSKAFLGLTVSCARCHDHKFDAITTKDYYALFGYLRSSRYQQASIRPDQNRDAIGKLEALKGKLAGARGDEVVEVRARDEVRAGDEVFEDFDRPDFGGWTATGEAFGRGPSKDGEIRVHASGVEAVPSGVAHSGLISDRLQGVLRSPSFAIRSKFIHYRVAGHLGRINLVVEGFDKNRDPIYGPLVLGVESPGYRWVRQDVGMWAGKDAYIEVSDGGLVDYTAGKGALTDGGGSIALDAVVFSDRATPPDWNSSSRGGPVGFGQDVSASLAEYRRVEAGLAEPTYTPALADGPGQDEPVHVRGSSKVRGEMVPRRFLEAIAGASQPSPGRGSGRLELAMRVVDPANPLTARVLVNRLWKHHFGEGLVRTPDDFGRMGQAPSHPELLDWLARRFVEGGWSVKSMHKMMVLSRAYRMRSDAQAAADLADPTNRLLHRMNPRRLEAEAIRDAMLACSGSLDATMYGPGVPVHLTAFMEGRGRPGHSGPLDGSGRRSIYQEVRRNFLSAMLLTFDTPAPASPMGRRNVSNVPAQSLTLWNDPFVVDQARRWAGQATAGPAKSTSERVQSLYLTAFGRPPTADELAEASDFLEDDGPNVWADFCHVLFNVKEFLYVP